MAERENPWPVSGFLWIRWTQPGTGPDGPDDCSACMLVDDCAHCGSCWCTWIFANPFLHTIAHWECACFLRGFNPNTPGISPDPIPRKQSYFTIESDDNELNNTPFNSFEGFDLGKIEKILISGSKTLSDKVLIIKYDSIKDKYYLVPQEIQTVYGQTSTEIIIGVNDYNFTKNFVFSSKTETGNDDVLFTTTIDVSGKSQAMLSLKGQLLAKHVDTSDSYEQFIFSTGRNINYEGSTTLYTLARNVYDTFIYAYDSNDLVALNNGTQYIKSTLTGSDKQYLQPSFSTIGHKLEWLEKSLLPYVEFVEVSAGVYTLNIKCNPILRNTTKNINWFGNFELTIAST